MTDQLPEPWLRGPMEGIRSTLQPVAHALIAADEEIRRVVGSLEDEQVWTKVGGASSVGFHVLHLAGSTDRLFSYANGEALSEEQRAALKRERLADELRPSSEDLLLNWGRTFDEAMHRLRTTFADMDLEDVRYVGRAQLPSTVLGLLFHAAEHAARHAGQITTTARAQESS